MANRTTVKSNIAGINVPSVTNAQMNTMLQNELADNVVFLEDVAVIQNSSLSAITVDFTDKDRIDLTRTGGSLSITLTGLGDGNVKYLAITKTAGNAVTFTGGVDDVTPAKSEITAASSVLYEIFRKGSNYFARAVFQSVLSAGTTRKGLIEIATQTESNNLSDASRAVTPGTQPIAATAQQGLVELATNTETVTGTDATRGTTPAGVQAVRADIKATNEAWQAITLNAALFTSASYVETYKDNTGNVHVRGANLRPNSSLTNTTLRYLAATLPVGYHGDGTHFIQFLAHLKAGVGETGFTRTAIFATVVNDEIFFAGSTTLDASHFVDFYVIFREE